LEDSQDYLQRDATRPNAHDGNDLPFPSFDPAIDERNNSSYSQEAYADEADDPHHGLGVVEHRIDHKQEAEQTRKPERVRDPLEHGSRLPKEIVLLETMRRQNSGLDCNGQFRLFESGVQEMSARCDFAAESYDCNISSSPQRAF